MQTTTTTLIQRVDAPGALSETLSTGTVARVLGGIPPVLATPVLAGAGVVTLGVAGYVVEETVGN